MGVVGHRAEPHVWQNRCDANTRNRDAWGGGRILIKKPPVSALARQSADCKISTFVSDVPISASLGSVKTK